MEDEDYQYLDERVTDLEDQLEELKAARLCMTCGRLALPGNHQHEGEDGGLNWNATGGS